jgi:hypothetical protein
LLPPPKIFSSCTSTKTIKKEFKIPNLPSTSTFFRGVTNELVNSDVICNYTCKSYARKKNYECKAAMRAKFIANGTDVVVEYSSEDHNHNPIGVLPHLSEEMKVEIRDYLKQPNTPTAKMIRNELLVFFNLKIYDIFI